MCPAEERPGRRRQPPRPSGSALREFSLRLTLRRPVSPSSSPRLEKRRLLQRTRRFAPRPWLVASLRHLESNRATISHRTWWTLPSDRLYLSVISLGVLIGQHLVADFGSDALTEGLVRSAWHQLVK